MTTDPKEGGKGACEIYELCQIRPVSGLMEHREELVMKVRGGEVRISDGSSLDFIKRQVDAAFTLRVRPLVEALHNRAMMAHIMNDGGSCNGQYEDCRACKKYRDLEEDFRRG